MKVFLRNNRRGTGYPISSDYKAMTLSRHVLPRALLIFLVVRLKKFLLLIFIVSLFGVSGKRNLTSWVTQGLTLYPLVTRDCVTGEIIING